MTTPYPKRAEIAALNDGDEITIIPADVRLAAKRGFIRTTAQAYAASIGTGVISASALIATVQNPDPTALICTAVAALISPLASGLASYLTIIGKGIPGDYQDEILTDPVGPLTDSE